MSLLKKRTQGRKGRQAAREKFVLIRAIRGFFQWTHELTRIFISPFVLIRLIRGKTSLVLAGPG